MRRRRLWLCLPPLVMCLIDDAITLHAQDDLYWSGLWHLGVECNPVVRYTMQQHPLMMQVLTVAWIGAFAAAIVWGPRRFALFVSLAVTFAHGSAAGTWLNQQPDGYYGAMGLCVLGAALFVVALDCWRWDQLVFPPGNSADIHVD